MKINFHLTYLFVALSFILTGYFSNLLIFTSIIIFHEIGHYITAKITGLNPIKITIYPYGGITKLDHPINISTNKELIVAISGIIFQTIYFLIIILLYRSGIIREYIYNLFSTYHNSILFFNMLPIHPLDGSKVINLFLSKFLPYKFTLKLNIILSIITIIILLLVHYYHFNYTMIFIIPLIINNIIKYYKNINYYFNKFLLERYIHNIKFKRTIIINNINNMYKEKYHIFKNKNEYFTENQVLISRFKGKL